jgi:mono/diheme cytochrome c family protein
MKRAILSAVALLALAASANAQSITNGKRVAENICSDCHLIDSTEMRGKAPGLAAVARMPSSTELALKVFLRTPHAAMPAVMLSTDEMNDVVAYIMCLDDKARCQRP